MIISWSVPGQPTSLLEIKLEEVYSDFGASLLKVCACVRRYKSLSAHSSKSGLAGRAAPAAGDSRTPHATAETDFNVFPKRETAQRPQ